MKDLLFIILSGGYRILVQVLPILLMLGFMTGVAFNLYYLQMLPLWAVLAIVLPISGLGVYGYGKYLRLW
jgi:hypothetical protein